MCVQYRGGNIMSTVGEYHEYRGGISRVPWGNITSTVREYHEYRGGNITSTDNIKDWSIERGRYQGIKREETFCLVCKYVWY